MESLLKSTGVLVSTLIAVILLSGCSTDPKKLQQINESDRYLSTPALTPLQAPAGLTLPNRNRQFDLPATTTDGALGSAVDIRPPTMKAHQVPPSSL